MTTYIATAPDGSEHTRKTDRVFTHAVLLKGKQGWEAVGYCGRPDLAEKKRGEHLGSVVVECSVLGDRAADKPKAEATEDAATLKPVSEQVPEQPKLTIGRLIEELLMDETLGYAAIVDRVMVDFPNAKTTTRSVASVAAVMRRRGAVVPMRRKPQG